jgi:hypothetical protein
MPSTTTKTGSNSSTGNASASGGSAPAAANTNPDPTKAPEKPKDLLEEIRNFSKDSLNNPTEKKAEEKAEESKSKSWTDELAETMAKRNAAINGSDDEDGGDENDSSSDAGDDQDWSLDKELSDSDIAPASEIDWSLARMEYLKKQIDIVNYEALAKAVKRADAKKISEITKSINAADTAMQKGNKEQIISMAKEAIKKNAENIKSYTPYWTAAEIAKKYLSVGATESIPENMTEEDIKKVCVINYLYAKNSAGGVDVNVADINDVEKSVGIIKALCEKLNEDGLVSSADYFNSLIYKQGTDKELDRDNIKGIMAVSLAMAMAEKEDVTNAAGHAKMINEITSVPSDITDSNQIEAWKEIVKKYYSSL